MNTKSSEKIVTSSFVDVENSIKSGIQNPLSSYLERLAYELKNSKKVTNNTLLKSSKWTKCCYDLLAKLISEDLKDQLSTDQKMTMGSSLSAKTIQKVISTNYKIGFPIDPRTLNTLNKVVVFLGYDHWDHFVNSKGTDVQQNSWS